MKNKPYKWRYSTKGLFLGMKMMILIDYKTLTPLFFHVCPANVHESRIYSLILEMLKRKKLIRPDRDKVRCSTSDHSEEEFQVGET